MSRFRFFVLIAGAICAYSLLIFNIYNLQIQNGDYYRSRVISQSRASGFLRAQRGSIFFTDRNQNQIPAAINKELPSIFAVPKEIRDVEEAVSALQPILGLNEEKLKKFLSKPNDEYELLVAKASEEQVEGVNLAGIPGIYVDSQPFRFYPFEKLAAHLLGFVGISDDNLISGRYGVEALYEDFLAGSAGKFEGGKVSEPIHGKDLALTIDRNIQAEAEDILDGLLKKYEATGGTVIVQDPKTGKILVLTNAPTFDPNEYSKYPVASFLNPAVQAIYEPGSILKVITMAAGIDSGKITPETVYNDPGFLKFDKYTIKNWDLKAHGRVTMTEVIEGSINTGAVFAEQKTGHAAFYDYLVNFGLSEETHIELPGELSGNLRNLQNTNRDINFATAAFGQGISVTPIGLINAISAIANRGILMKASIFQNEEPKEIRRVISEESAKKVTKMMVSAVRKAGVANIEHYEVAGKTGTAQIPNPRGKGYLEDQYINTYVGFAPATNPRFVILIKLDKPKGAALAGSTVVPAFRELTQYILNYYNLPPDSL
jgi:cell division protein FtsI/penicillin-binding protein 2